MTELAAATEQWGVAIANNDINGQLDAYSRLSWAIVTSPSEELKEFCWRYCVSFDKVPTPLLVIAARLVANRYRDDLEVVSQCKNIFQFYCDPLEEEEACAGL